MSDLGVCDGAVATHTAFDKCVNMGATAVENQIGAAGVANVGRTDDARLKGLFGTVSIVDQGVTPHQSAAQPGTDVQRESQGQSGPEKGGPQMSNENADREAKVAEAVKFNVKAIAALGLDPDAAIAALEYLNIREGVTKAGNPEEQAQMLQTLKKAGPDVIGELDLIADAYNNRSH